MQSGLDSRRSVKRREGQQPIENPPVQTRLVASVRATKISTVSGTRVSRMIALLVADLMDTDTVQTPIPVR
jgi:hypothetical protein